MLKRLLRIVVVLFLPYFGVDMLTPEVPGAFTFDGDQAVEVVHEDRTPVGPSVPAGSRPSPESWTLPRLTRTALVDSAPAVPRPGWRVPLRGARSALDAAPSSEDSH